MPLASTIFLAPVQVITLNLSHSDPYTRLFDASPSQTQMVMALLGLVSDRVGPIYQVILEGEAQHFRHLAHNSMINLLESYIFIELFLIN